MSISQDEIAAAATDLYEAETSGRQIGLLSQRFPDLDMDGAYAIQAAYVAKKTAAGRLAVGWKIGLTSKAMQSALGIDTPDSGILLDDMVFDDGSNVPAGRFIEPRIEAEIAFLMGSDLNATDVTRAAVIAATESIAPAIEILDTRIFRADPGTGKPRRVFDTIADNAANAGVVLGAARHAPDRIDPRWVGAIVSRDSVVEETGLGAGVLNDPVESVLWLARRMAAYGQQIRAGDIVLSGSFIRPIECPPGTDINADFGDFGSVDLRFAGCE